MSEPLKRAKAALKQIPDWNSEDAKIIRSLGSGPSNDVWLVEHQSKKYALRIDKPFVKELPLDRYNEHAIHQILAKAALSPQIVFSNPNDGLLLIDYIDGRTWDGSDFNDKDQLSLLANHLNKLHSLSPPVAHYDLAGGIKKYAQELDQKQSALWASEALTLLSEMSERPLVLCHNDLHPQNIIETVSAGKKRLWFIDLEYSGLGNPLFDLVTVTNHHCLSNELVAHFLRAYCGSINPITQNDLELQGKVNDRLLALWYSVVLKNDGSDLEAKAFLEKLKRRIASL